MHNCKIWLQHYNISSHPRYTALTATSPKHEYRGQYSKSHCDVTDDVIVEKMVSFYTSWIKKIPLKVSERCPVNHRLRQYLSLRCTLNADWIKALSKFDLLFDLVTLPMSYESVTHNLQNYTSPPVYLQIVVCVAPVLPSLTVVPHTNKQIHKHIWWKQYHLDRSCARGIVLKACIKYRDK